MTIAVSDAGYGPPPLVGMFPVHAHRGSGRGMWLLHLLLLLSEIHHRSTSEGYTVTFRLGAERRLPAEASQPPWS